ncbi:type II toxin-antitoxin system RelE/ParE family toxin [Dactylosporangium aurantiacum]|uniref:Type II toxin-antitoxin system RelE/ParE family toxin n=1 Tax=Dactylosporangium aurantiacum TaxID=35754 RepID=A0A9Q9IE09_9ACTN|nr:type II toxin-antitoxin system RelE/ParE family toxin [Dactylosporangium aurantiacum]MDG6109088.1 type II toxin-antitoxin system RelE/ParE family toxin [Dactylosporangium aurantiacum]UWZ54584.1 type II toxin-antitoxin system RelE/ParE family toxin [Dactylosporangium aurantiacum]
MATSEWGIYVVNEVRTWIFSLEPAAKARVVQAIDALAESGPGLGRPLVDTITHSSLANLKELRPGTMRILFVFDPWRSSILLVAGDKAAQWEGWYREAIPLAEQRYEIYLKERAQEEGGQQ